MKRGSNIVGVGAYNERLVLALIRRHGAMSKAELAKRTGLSRQTLTDVVGRLEDEGKLRREEPRRGKIGQPLVPFSLNPDGAYSIGLKIGRKSHELILMNFTGQVLQSFRTVCAYPTPEHLQDFVRASWASLKATTPPETLAKVIGVGVAMPSDLWRWAEEIQVPPEYMERWEHFDVAAFITALTGLSVDAMNDMTAACIGEMIFGDLPDLNSFIYFNIGAFVGGGLVINDSVVYGNHLNAGAFGSMLTLDGGDANAPPRQLLSCVSIVRLQRDCEAAGLDPAMLWEYDQPWPGIDHVLDPWIDETAWHLACASINAVAVVDVPYVVIDGSVPPDVRARLIARVRERIAGLRATGLKPITVVPGTLHYAARCIGGAALPMHLNYSWDPVALYKESTAEQKPAAAG